MFAVLAPQPPVASRSKPRSEGSARCTTRPPGAGSELATLAAAPESARADREQTARPRDSVRGATTRNGKLGGGKIRIASHTALPKLRHVNIGDGGKQIRNLRGPRRSTQRVRPSFKSCCRSQTGPAMNDKPSSLKAGARFSKAACPTKL